MNANYPAITSKMRGLEKSVSPYDPSQNRTDALRIKRSRPKDSNTPLYWGNVASGYRDNPPIKAENRLSSLPLPAKSPPLHGQSLGAGYGLLGSGE